jgi:hypothetical protein
MATAPERRVKHKACKKGARRPGDWFRRLTSASSVEPRRCLSRCSSDGDRRPKEGRQSPQYVDRPNGEPACLDPGHRVPACRSGESTIAAEAFMNNAG